MKTFLLAVGFMALALMAAAADTAEPFAIRGFHLDLRIQVMKMPALRQFAEQLSHNGINTLIVEWEGTYTSSGTTSTRRSARMKRTFPRFARAKRKATGHYLPGSIPTLRLRIPVPISISVETKPIC